MSLKPSVVEPIPKQTARVARAAFPKGNLYLAMRDKLGALFEDDPSKCLVRKKNPERPEKAGKKKVVS